MTFVGRRAELDLLRAAVARARAGSAEVVLVEGGPGIGKTALVRHVLDDNPDLIVVRAGGDEAERELGLGLLEQLCVSAGSPAGGRTASDPVVAGATFLHLLGTLEERGPVAVVVEDAQWSDAASLQAIAFALRRLGGDQVIAVFTARDTDDLPEALARLARDRGTHLYLGGLEVAELRELGTAMGRELTLAAAERLHAHTQGNPLHARALLREIGSLVPDGALPAPRSLQQLVLGKLASCSTETESLVVALAVLGSRVPLRLAAELAGLADPSGAVDEAAQAELLVQDADQVAFAHPLIRAAVYQDLGPARRAALHARASTIADRPLAVLRHRVSAAIEPDRELFDDLYAAAAEQTRDRAWTTAIQLHRWAAAVAPDRAMREDALLRATGNRLMTGDVSEAVQRLGRFDDYLESPRRAAVFGAVALGRGRYAEANELLSKAWTRLDTDADPELAGTVSTHLATLQIVRGHLEAALVWVWRGVRYAPASAEPLNLLLFALAFAGRTAGAAELVEDTVFEPGRPDGLLGRGCVRMWTGDLGGAREDLRAAEDAARSLGPFRSWLGSVIALSLLDLQSGEWDGSVARARLAVSAAADAGMEGMEPLAYLALAFPLALRGEATEARQAADRAARLPAAMPLAGAVAAALADLTGGDAAAAIERLEPVRALAEIVPATREPWMLRWREVAVQALVALGRLDEAETMLGEIQTQAEAWELEALSVVAARLRAVLDTAGGRPDEACASLVQALTMHTRLDLPFERALAEQLLGELHAAGSRPQEAERLLGSALETFRRVGAVPFARRCRATLERLSGRSVPDVPRRFQLTAQERAVARLVSRGLSNKQIASQLVVSVKTVEFHLRNAFAKLGVASRVQLVRALEEAGYT